MCALKLTIPQTRKGLQGLRTLWKDHSAEQPFDMSRKLPGCDVPAAEFAYAFVLGIHREKPRSVAHRRTKTKKRAPPP